MEKENKDQPVAYDRVVEILQRYVFNDAAAAEPEYVREVLTDVCGIKKDELKALGLDGLFPEDYDI